MITIFTPATDLPATKQNEKKEAQLPDLEGPSDHVIANILNFSRSLEICKSRLVGEVEIVKT